MKKVFQIVSKSVVKCELSLVDTNVYADYKKAELKQLKLYRNYPGNTYYIIELTINEEE